LRNFAVVGGCEGALAVLVFAMFAVHFTQRIGVVWVAKVPHQSCVCVCKCVCFCVYLHAYKYIYRYIHIHAYKYIYRYIHIDI
jgi:hypothetical protein